ncbi:hypothetical protein BDC45DRAFT_517854 [Circinella umbellata]|nr:hypothetical protein BDC45DRAFT_517854 [Circinella umbellata]
MMPSQLPSSYTTQDGHSNGSQVAIIVAGIVGSLAFIAAVVLVFSCRKRKKERKKETMANAYLEFSQ